MMEASASKAEHSSQQLLLTVLGSYFPNDMDGEPLPSRFFVEALADFDLSEIATRNALSRVARRGFLQPIRNGREFNYRLTEMAHNRHDRRLKEIVGYGLGGEVWDGTWTVVAFSVREQHRELRHQLRQTLRVLKFAPLYDGVWVSPWALSPEDQDRIRDLGVAKLTIFGGISDLNFAEEGSPVTAFDLQSVRSGLEAFVERCRYVVDAIDDGAVPPTMALRLRTETLRDWRNLSEADPGLPSALLPADWPLKEARGLFERIYDALTDGAEERMRHHLHTASPSANFVVQSLTTAEVAALEVGGTNSGLLLPQ